MSGGELGQSVGAVGTPTAWQARAAAVHVADRIGAEHPHPDDETDPQGAGRQLAHDPAVRAELLLLLDVIGHSKESA